MVDLPYDILLHISTFLPPDSLWKLRVLNRALYDIALDVRYKRVDVPLEFKKIKKYSQGFEQFRDDIAKRVREIAYRQNAKTLFPVKSKVSKMPKVFSFMKRRFDNMHNRGDISSVKGTMTWFTNLQTLRIETQYDMLEETLLECIPLFHTNFRVSSDSLRNLEFSIPHNKFATIFPADLYFPRLAAILFIFSQSTEIREPSEQPSFTVAAETTIAPFINRHKKTLTSIDLRIYGFTELWPPMVIVFAISPLIQAITHITNLRSISFGITGMDRHDPMADFIKLHSGTLQKIIIYLPDECQYPDKIFDSIGETRFPRLKVLAICERVVYGPQPEDQGPRMITALIHRSSSSLTSLSIAPIKLSRRDICVLLNPAGDASISFAAMSFLSVTLGSLTTDILDLLVDCLPNLQELDLRVADVHVLLEEGRMVFSDQGDYEMMTQRRYTNWGLKHFNFAISDSRPTHELTLLLVGAFPSLITFCGVETGAVYLPRIRT